MKKTIMGAMMALTMLSGQALAAGDVAAGQAKAGVCAACHGADGIAVIPGYPNLKGQNEQYIASSIKAYKAGQRTGGLAPVMQAQANLLSDEDIANLAAYYASLK
ncbi:MULTISPECIES: c-type cytochrome [Vibrio]|uniref:Cytochrome c n=1 Tax=Vibrio campbellii TaxID=680 RepID=A0A1Q1PG17_9VIBR|nr:MULTISPECIES: cytochrome c [Vibrio]EDL67005.1 cytochrome c554 [Vibrio campbellii HY01]MED5506139.1 cytochrome c [Pseudomonadota bacterium]AQM69182.1 Cytochrome c-554(548) [Vibrio campbellii]ARR43738.1 cytochrome C biogenesis protein CcsB [Vibrio campbellii]AUV85427.1 cytochrome C biogenesis protein CcsB [Vibrio campbellii]|tara:strand:- start:1720 stop:2034 length:315 start_codon:yes stop_codon:yes gene_type:complete